MDISDLRDFDEQQHGGADDYAASKARTLTEMEALAGFSFQPDSSEQKETAVNITKVTVSYGGTVNLGDYSNAKIEVTYEAIVGENQDAHAVKTVLLALTRAAFAAEVATLDSVQAWRYLKTTAPELIPAKDGK